MLRHKLFFNDEYIPQFNFSLNENGCSEEKKQCKTSGMNSETGPVQSSTPVKKILHPAQICTSPAQKGKDKKSYSANQKDYSATIVDFPVSEKDYESDSDSMSVAGFFSSHNQKVPYTFQEDEEIVNYVLKGQCIFRVSSVLLWKHLEHLKKNPKRTHQSLKNRFLRNIKPHLFTTYRHLIPDEEAVQKILTKFPELKSQINRRETLSRIKLPERNVNLEESEGNTSTRNSQEHPNNAEKANGASECLPDPIVPSTPVQKSPQTSRKLDFLRKVELNGDSLTVLVNLNFEHPPTKSVGIYTRYKNLKLTNKSVPCPTCGRGGDGSGGGGSEEDLDSGAESDAFISNSVESKKTEGSSSKKKLITKKFKHSNNQKRKGKNLNPKFNDSQRSCSPSMLNDIDEMDESFESTTKSVENKSEAEPKVSNSPVLIREADSTPAEPSSVSDKDTDSIYRSTVAQYRKLIDSDEEELLVKKCLRKNRKTIGFDSNLSVEDMEVDSYFVRSSSPCLESAAAAAASDSTTVNESIRNKNIANSTLAQNMINMMGNKNNI